MPRGVSLYDQALLQGRLWTPDLVTTVFWLDAFDLSTIKINAGVSDWLDKKGNGLNAVQATGAYQPTYSPVAMNGLPGIVSDGVNDFMDISTTAGRNITHSIHWACMYLTIGGGDQYRPSVATLPAGTGALHYVVNPTGNFQAAYPYYSGASASVATAIPDPYYAVNAPELLSFRPNGTGWGIWRNGTLQMTTNLLVASTDMTGYRLFGETTSSRYCNLVLSEIFMIENTNSRLAEMADAYLAWRWDLRWRLNANNAFINRPPMIGD